MGISGALSMKLFDIVSENWGEIICKILKEKFEINIKK